MTRTRLALAAALLLALVASSEATTWSDVKRRCPLCNKEGTYSEIASYGSYIYEWPETYQMLLWPRTRAPCSSAGAATSAR